MIVADFWCSHPDFRGLGVTPCFRLHVDADHETEEKGSKSQEKRGQESEHQLLHEAEDGGRRAVRHDEEGKEPRGKEETTR